MTTSPYLGAQRRTVPGAPGTGGFQSPFGGGGGLGDVIDETELRDLLRKFRRTQPGSGRSDAERGKLARSQGNRNQRRAFNALSREKRTNAQRQLKAQARAAAKAAKILRRIAKRHPLGVAVDIAIAMAGRSRSAAMTDLSHYGNIAFQCGDVGASHCERVVGAGTILCDSLGFFPADGSCALPGPLGITGGGLFAQRAARPVNPPIFWRDCAVTFWRGKFNGSVPQPAPGVHRTVPRQPALPSAGPWGRNEDVPKWAQPQGPHTEGHGVGPRWPALNPEALPIARPSISPKPIPLRLLGLRKHFPAYQKGGLELSKSGYSVGQRTPEAERKTGPTIEFRPNAPGVPIPPEHKFAPPGRRTKEIKTGGFRLLMKVVNGITETNDFIDSLYEGIDEACKKKAERKYKRMSGYSFMRPQDKARALYDCAGPNFDVCKSVKALVENQVEDFVFGKTGQRLGKLARQTSARKVPIGFQAGGSLGKLGRGNRGQKTGGSPWANWTDRIVKCE